MPWSALDDRRLREFYAQHRGGQPIPTADIAAVLGKTPAAVRSRAHALKITEPDRPRGHPPVEVVPCPVCGTPFRPASRGADVVRVRTCSPSCGTRLQWTEHEHPRGAAGLVHSEATRAAMSAKSKAWWDALPAEQREARVALLLAGDRRPTENTHTRARGGRRADLNDRYFRSSWEANYARWLNFLMAGGTISSWDYEPKTFRFPVERGVLSYTPDFLITHPDGSAEWHEVKGWLTKKGATALKRFARYYPEETLIMIDGPVYNSIASQARRLIEGWE